MNFLKTLLAVLVGLIIFTGIMFFVVLGFISAASQEDAVVVSENSVMRLNLKRTITEKSINDPFGLPFLPIPVESASGLVELKSAIAHAKEDPKIKGIYLEAPFVISGFAKLEELREALEDFKESGKFIVSYSDFYTEGGYYISSVADDIFMSPAGIFELNGLSVEISFYQKMLEKLEIQPLVFRVGEYKSAVEPFLRSDMSDENKEQYESFINSIYSNLIREMSEARRIDMADLRRISDNMEVRTASQAVELGLVDELKYEDEVFDKLREELDLEEDAEINFISAGKYYKSYTSGYSPNRIAVIVASGEIVMGEGDQENIGSELFIKELRAAARSSRIKAIVLRINSPGGNYIASDLLWKEIKEASKAKPVIASLSDYAASGGYYLAMACDTIIADRTTITGSIGVFRLQFTIHDFLQNKLGITSDRVNTGKYSDMNSALRPMSDAEKAIIQEEVNEVYDAFLTKASEGRGLSKDSIGKIAGGRVWTGVQALENGLVDMLGNLDDAIKLSAELAEVEDDYSVSYLPVRKTLFEEILYQMENETKTRILREETGVLYPYVEKLLKLQNLEGIQARIPGEITIH